MRGIDNFLFGVNPLKVVWQLTEFLALKERGDGGGFFVTQNKGFKLFLIGCRDIQCHDDGFAGCTFVAFA